jgi:hypothetical protein
MVFWYVIRFVWRAIENKVFQDSVSSRHTLILKLNYQHSGIWFLELAFLSPPV